MGWPPTPQVISVRTRCGCGGGGGCCGCCGCRRRRRRGRRAHAEPSCAQRKLMSCPGMYIPIKTSRRATGRKQGFSPQTYDDQENKELFATHSGRKKIYYEKIKSRVRFYLVWTIYTGIWLTNVYRPSKHHFPVLPKDRFTKSVITKDRFD